MALLELPRGVTPAGLAGGFALPGAVPLSGRIEESFGRRLDALPTDTRTLLQLAAADPVGEPSLLWRAAERLAIAPEAATPAVESGLIEFGARVRFRHPLVRSAAYRSASLQARQAVHRGSPTSPIPTSIPTAGPGIGPRPRPHPMRRSPRNSSDRLVAPRRVAGWRRRLRS